MFEFDPRKSEANEKKHGIDFHEAQNLWKVPSITIESKHTTEPRFLLIAQWHGKYWTAIFTTRREVIRIISVRHSRNNEKELLLSD
ncbi:MAG: BrnT family toxin [Deltaproteobacteria bacterium]|nr:BrnT family toxin [Deltaproteobacteria bacterium]